MEYCPNCNNIFNITKDGAQTGGVSSESASTEEEKLIAKLLTNKHITEKDLSNISLENLIDTLAYKKLKHKQKELIYNKIQDLLPDDQKKIFAEKPRQNLEKINYICNNCGYRKPIESGTLIFSKVSNDISQSYSPSQVDDMKYSDILRKTRKYICPNDNCESHTNFQKREAAFFRKNNTFKIQYICLACDTIF